MDANAFLETAAGLGYRLVQLADNLPMHALESEARERLRARADELGVALQLGTAGLTEANLERYLALAVELGSPILRVVTDVAGYEPTVDEVKTMLRRALPAFERAGVVLALENHDRFKVSTYVDVMEDLAHPYLGICLDTVNSFGALEGPDLVVERLAPYVVNLHLKDFVVRRLSHRMGFELIGAPAGQGMLNVKGLLERFSGDGGGGRAGAGSAVTAVLELWPPEATTLEATIARERRWLEESTAYLRGLAAAVV